MNSTARQPFTAQDRELWLERLDDLRALVAAMPAYTPCNRCEFFAEGGWCARFEAQVPEHALEAECPEFVKDEIPF